MTKKMIPEIIKPASILLSQHDAAVSFCGKVSRLISAGKGNYTTNNRKEIQAA
ncbi:hypothetical protein [Hornefia butyriciproducens]|uniref:hypothetical protein n=1 Tax=Hornefia butyriciproducens TaxID=2652293 RepID=UPI0029FC4BBA|nr:hypothetical protein [Hornefia butyriciproducens]MDD7019508.1 hypothetical protein [Hornefia butyriciproducens]